MTLTAPNLDDRRFQDLVDDAKRLVQRNTTYWTDHNVTSHHHFVSVEDSLQPGSATYLDAIRDALADAMRSDPRVFLL